MRASAVICTPIEDADAESILPEGIDVETRFRANPAILWNHGLDPLMPLPIARGDTADGLLGITVRNGEMVGDSYFTNRVRESEQVFCLIEEKIVRGTSVRVEPDYSKVVKKGMVTTYPVSVLIEWSWLALGCNPEAVAKALGRGTLAGSTICEPLLKTLKPLLPKRMNLWSPGEPNMATNPTKPAEAPPAVAKALPGDVSAGNPIIDKAAPPPASPPPAENEPALDEPSTDSPSGQVLSAVTATLQGLIDNLTAAANTYENPEAIAFVTGSLVPALTDLIGETDGIYAKVSGGKSQAKSDDAPPDEEVLKSFLSTGSRGAALGGYAMRLGNLATAKNLTSDQRLTVTGIVKHLSGLTAKARDSAKAKEAPKPAAEEVNPDLLKRLNDAAAKVKEGTEKLAALCPAAA